MSGCGYSTAITAQWMSYMGLTFTVSQITFMHELMQSQSKKGQKNQKIIVMKG